MFIEDFGNQRIRMIDGSGIIHAVAGTGVAGSFGDGGMATATQLYNPEGIAFDACNNLYIADDAIHLIRKVSFNAPTSPTIAITGITTASVGTTVTRNATVSGIGSGGYSIKWYKNSILFSTTAAPSISYIKGTGTDDIPAKLIPTIIYCCDSIMSLKHVITESPVEINDILYSSFSVSHCPNPVNNMLTVSAIGKLNNITVSNFVGQLLISKKFNSDNIQIDVANLPTGVYLIRFKDYYTGKFVKQ